jgi:hypothetical protein
MKKTKIFFDTEFTGLHQNTSLISIGMVSDCGCEFYAEFTDYNKIDIDEWLEKNVIQNLDHPKGDVRDCIVQEDRPKNMRVYGTSDEVKFYLEKWLQNFDEIEMWSDCYAWDWVLFCQIFSGAMAIPKNVYYIPFDISTLFWSKGIDPDVSRESFAQIQNQGKTQKHNALWDAKVIKGCWEKLGSTKKIKNWEQYIPEKKTLVLSAFPGCGKSYLYNNVKDLQILDSDSSGFDKSHFPENYIKHIRQNIGKVDIILVSSHKEVRDALFQNDISFILVYPEIGSKSEYIQRYLDRKSPEKFIQLLDTNWNDWIRGMDQQPGCRRIILKPGKFLSDVVEDLNM